MLNKSFFGFLVLGSLLASCSKQVFSIDSQVDQQKICNMARLDHSDCTYKSLIGIPRIGSYVINSPIRLLAKGTATVIVKTYNDPIDPVATSIPLTVDLINLPAGISVKGSSSCNVLAGSGSCSFILQSKATTSFPSKFYSANVQSIFDWNGKIVSVVSPFSINYGN